MEFKDYYSILGVEPSAGEAEIKTAYRRLARKYHPDVSKEADAEERFKAVNEAYEALRDPEKRKAYDQLRAQGYRPGEEFRPPPDFGWSQSFDFNDIFGSAAGASAHGGGAGGFSDFFESLFGGRAQSARRPQGQETARRSDTRAKLAVPLSAVYNGDQVRITLNGRQLEVKIPKGIRAGQMIRLTGQGNNGGNLLLEIEYQPHPQFEVDGRNILFTLSVMPWQAALGTSLSVPTLGGAVDLKIPADSDAGRKLRLRGRGLPGNPPGDQIVELEIMAPQPTNEIQRQAYRDMASAFGDHRTE